MRNYIFSSAAVILLAIGLTNGQTNDPQNSRCSNQEGRFISDWNDCQAYFFCSGGIARPGRCPDGFLFDEIRQMCNFPDQVDCTISSCPAAGFHDLPMPGSCVDFIRCINGHATFHTCPDGMVFDANINQCNFPDRFECDINHQCPAVTDPNNPVFIPSPHSCEEFFICINGEAVPQRCDEGIWWNQDLQVCDDPSNVECDIDNGGGEGEVPAGFCPPGVTDIRAHPTDCALFVVCSDGVATVMACGEGLAWDEANQRCDRAELVGC